MIIILRVQKLTSLYPQLRGYASKVKKHFLHSLEEHKGDLQLFKEVFMYGISHWCGEHDPKYCKHDLENVQKKVLTDPKAKQALQELMTLFCDEADQCI